MPQDPKPWQNAHFQPTDVRNSRKVSCIRAALSIAGLLAAIYCLRAQASEFYSPHSVCKNYQVILDGMPSNASISLCRSAIYRGPFAISAYDLIERDQLTGAPTAVLIEPRVTVEFIGVEPPLVPRKVLEDFGKPSLLPRSRVIGGVWLRRELLWILLSMAALATVLSGLQLLGTTRHLRRHKRWLCTNCSYPLPMEDEPVCPECGTRHIP